MRKTLFLLLVITLCNAKIVSAQWSRTTGGVIYPTLTTDRLGIGTTDFSFSELLYLKGSARFNGNLTIGTDEFGMHCNIYTKGGFITTQGSGGTGIILRLAMR